MCEVISSKSVVMNRPIPVYKRCAVVGGKLYSQFMPIDRTECTGIPDKTFNLQFAERTMYWDGESRKEDIALKSEYGPGLCVYMGYFPPGEQFLSLYIPIGAEFYLINITKKRSGTGFAASHLVGSDYAHTHIKQIPAFNR